METVKSYITKNPCYQNNTKRIDSRYKKFQDNGPQGAFLHSVGCAQPDASAFIKRWDSKDCANVAVHGIIDANSGVVYQLLPWNYRGWHAGGPANNTHIGVEMCESKYIRYLKPGEPGYAPAKFAIKDKTKAVEDCVRTYHAAVELFAMLAEKYKWNVDRAIISHNEGGKKGIASGHVDPEHYWKGLGMPYTMEGFRKDVKAKMAENAKPKTTYRIQVGAFKTKKAAQAYLDGTVKPKFPTAYIVEDKG